VVLAAWHANTTPSPASEQTEKKVDYPWQKWLNEEVPYIISDQERIAFKHLEN